jgi:hypothetical protein
MSAVPRSTVPSGVGGESKRLLIGAQRLAQAALGDPDVGQRDRAAEDVGDVPGPPQPLGSDGVGTVRGLELAVTPEGEPHEGRRPGSGEVVAVGGTVDRPPGVADGGGGVAPDQGQGGAVHLDRPGKARQLSLVDDDHPRRRGWRARVLTAGLQPALDVGQPLLDALELPAGHQRPDEAHREHGPGPDHVVGDGVEPAPDGGLLPVPALGRDRQLDEPRRPLDVPDGQGVADRLGRFPVPLVPLAGPPVQGRHPVGVLVQEVGAPDVREQVVVAVPAAAVVERDQEQVARSSDSSTTFPSCWPVTASHSGPLRRSRIEVSTRKPRTGAGWLARTSSTR